MKNKKMFFCSLSIILLVIIISISGNAQNDYALKFTISPTTSYVLIPYSSSFNFNNSITLEAFIKLTELPPSRATIIGNQGDNESTSGASICIESNGDVTVKLGLVNSPGYSRTYSGLSWTFGQWYHIAVVYNGTNLRFYRNGTLVGQNYRSDKILNNDNNRYIGGYHYDFSPRDWFSGEIDEVRISNIARYTTNFTVSTSPFVSDSNTVGLWHFDEGTGNIAYDSSNNHNNGTIYGAQWVPGYFASIDNTPPADIQDLNATPGRFSGAVNLTWTSPGDNGMTGILKGIYKIQYSETQIQWNKNNAQISISTTGVSPGTIQSYTVTGLVPGVTYYFVIWTCDETLSNWSNVSNVANSYAYIEPNLPPNAPNNLRCDGTINPTNLGNLTPELSWTFSDPNTSDGQSAYRLLFANNISNLNNNIGNLWDTGKTSSSLNYVTYSGTSLSWGATYYWKVMTWDSSDVSGPYSTIGTIVMATTPNSPPNSPTNLKCNNIVNPNGINDFTPDLSWSFTDPDSGDTQSAYRILVADNMSYLDSNNGNKWDTNKVSSSGNVVTYAGSSLQYSTTYYWKVMVWDNHNSSSSYSTVASFSIMSIPQANFTHPYGVNNWNWPLTTCQKFQAAHIDRYRVMVPWDQCEPQDNNYQFSGYLNAVLDNANTLGAKVSLCAFAGFDSTPGPPPWTLQEPGKVLSYQPAKYAEFVTAMLDYCKTRGRLNVVEAVEILNEEPTCDASYQDNERDPSWYYANILKAGYNAVKSFNSANGTNILVVMDSIWLGAYHHLDELYQLGLKDYFDRINFHHYVQDFGAPEDPMYRGSIWHFPTTLKYLKYIAEQNNDSLKYIWITEFGWRITDEVKQANYNRSILDECRKSGFIERTNMYVGTSPNDSICMIRVNNDANPTSFYLKQTYNMYVDFGNQYPTWSSQDVQPLDVLTPASKDITIINPGFEQGVSGWLIVKTTDASVKHSGSYSGMQISTSSIRTIYYPAEPDRLYEIIAWIKVSASNPDNCMVHPRIVERYNGDDNTINFFEVQNYYGVVDTRNYPNGWRRLRWMYLVPPDKNEIAVEFWSTGSPGAGTFWIDDLSVRALNFTGGSSTEPVSNPNLTVDPPELDFGEVKINKLKIMYLIITNIGTNTTTGTITTDKLWIKVNPTSFVIEPNKNLIAEVTVDNELLAQEQGQYTGVITITTESGVKTVNVYLTATCILTKPNPYNPEKGLLTFFGDGIVPGETKIKIYTLSGELVREITSPVASNNVISKSGATQQPNSYEITWDGKTESGEPIASGMYLYTYESPKEKGVGKFTVIIK